MDLRGGVESKQESNKKCVLTHHVPTTHDMSLEEP